MNNLDKATIQKICDAGLEIWKTESLKLALNWSKQRTKLNDSNYSLEEQIAIKFID